jgi:tetratricopeptide (TPR) repeat protein
MQAQSVYNQGLDKAMLGAYREAIHDFSQALSMEPDNIDIYYNRGLTYLKAENYQAAIADFTEVIRRHKLDRSFAYTNEGLLLMTYVSRGNAYHQLGSYQKALEDYGQALIIDLKFSQAYYNRGLTHLELGNKQEALEDLETAAQLFTEQDNMVAYQNIQNLLEINF